LKHLILVSIVALALSGCGIQKPSIQSNEPFHIAAVEAVGPLPAESSPEQLEDLRARTAAVSAFVPETSNPRLLRLRIVRYHLKNAGMSIILGDSNNMTVSAEVLSMDGSSSMGTFQATVMSDAMVNGVVGAIIAAGQKESKVMRELDAEAANEILEKIYGTKTWQAWRKRH
jgi:hypothetical protein